MTSTSRSTAPGQSGSSCGGTASAWRVVPWRTLEAVEFATLTWVDWFNTRRLLGPLGDIPPAEFEAQ